MEVHADVVLMAKSGVDGVYTADPKKDPTAEKLSRLSYDDALRRDIRVMDQTAMTMCKDNNLTMVVFGMEGEGNVTRAILGEDLGTVVTP
jgi:uridylate kinase